MKSMEFNFDRIRKEIEKYTNTKQIKAEFSKLEEKVRNFDMHLKLSPEAKRKIDLVEKKYGEVVKAVNDAQKKLDVEFTKAVKNLKTTRSDLEKKLNGIRTKAQSHKNKIKATLDNSAKSSAKPARKTSAKKAAKTLKKVSTKTASKKSVARRAPAKKARKKV
jgi:hypothetical protein